MKEQLIMLILVQVALGLTIGAIPFIRWIWDFYIELWDDLNRERRYRKAVKAVEG